jgi:benzoyl-CoA reductase subunit C
VSAIEKFKQWTDNKHDYAREWKKRTGGKVVGTLCTYVPEEILYAAGILPVRMLGSHEQTMYAQAHIFDMFCPFSRDVLDQALRGRVEYLDGLVIAHSCIHQRQVYWAWRKHAPVEFSYYIPIPHGTQRPGRYEYMAAELNDFKEAVEEWLGKTITNEDLDRAIEIYNTNRRLLKQVYEFRKLDDPHLTGLEAMEIAVSNQVTDKQEHNQALEELLKELPERKLDREAGTRLMIIGSEDDDREFIEMVEEKMTLPATIVIEEHCTGSRYFWNEVIPQEDRIMAIGARYLDRVPCPSKDWPERLRFPHILDLAKEYNVEGVITMQQKFCDPHELDMPVLMKFLEDNGYPSYFLEFEITVPLGQFSTRVEAFLETMIDLV